MRNKNDMISLVNTLKKSETDFKDKRIAPIQETFKELRVMLQDKKK